MHLSRTPVITPVGELVYVDVIAAVKELVASEIYHLATPSFDRFHLLTFILDSAGITKKGQGIGSSSTPIILVPSSIRCLSSSTAAAILVGLTNVTDKDHLDLRAVMAPIIEAFKELDGMTLPCPHTGEMLPCRCRIALDGAAWLMVANTKGCAADVGKFAHSTASTADINDPTLHIPSTVGVEIGEMTEEIHKGKSTEQRKAAAGDTGGSMGRTLFFTAAYDIRRGSLHLLLTPTGWLWTLTCATLSEHGYLAEGGDFVLYLRSEFGLDVERIVTREHGPFLKILGGHGGRMLLMRNARLFVTGRRDDRWGGTEHAAYDVCLMLAEVWKVLHFLVDLVRTNHLPKFKAELPQMAMKAQQLMELCKIVFGKYTPYLSSFSNIVLHHCWEAYDMDRTYNNLFDDSTVEMLHYELAELGIGYGGGKLKNS